MAEQSDSLEVQTPWFKGKGPAKRAAEVVALLLSVAVGVGAYILHVHAGDTGKQHEITRQVLRDNTQQMTNIMKQMLELQKAALSEQREQTCLARFEGQEKQKNADFCRRIGSQR